MNLRVKLLAGYMIFVVALMVLGGWSAWRLREMGGVSRRIISNNYDSVVAAQDMKESLERQDSAALFALQGERASALHQLQQHRTGFDAAFSKAANNITEPGETQLIETIRQSRDGYYELFGNFLAATDSAQDANKSVEASSNANPVRGRQIYFAQLEPAFNRLRQQCDGLLHLNQRAMQQKSEGAASVAERWFLLTLGMATSLVIAGIVLAVFLSNRIVQPLRELTVTTRKIADGDLDVKAKVSSHDEVGLLAAEYNRMAERLQQLRRTDLGNLIIAQQTTEAAVDSLYDPVIITDAAGRITKLNRAAEEVFGPEAENTGKHIREIAAHTSIAEAVAETLDSLRPVASEEAASVLPLNVDGAERAFRLRTTPLRDDEGHVHGAVTLLEDITHLREIDRLKSEFIATASHELRTPLTSVELGVHMLLEGAAGDLTDKQTEVLEACREDCQRLERLMRDLLDLSKLEAGESAPRIGTVQVKDLIDRTVGHLRSQIDFKGIKLRTDVPSSLPPVSADSEQVERVISNLVNNAVRHTEGGGKIEITAQAREDYVAVSIADTGHGISPEHLPRIFDKFVQVPDAPSGGVGLGLAIAKRIIEMHNGQITVQSEPTRGTTFTFTLPTANKPANKPAKPASSVRV